MTKASDNKFPGIILQEAANDGSDFSNPDADYRRVFLGEDGQLHAKDSAGTVTDLGAAASGALTASGYTMATARLIGRTTASTGAPEEISVGSGLSLSAGSLSATGGSGNWTQLADSLLGSDTASFDFTSISGSYKHLRILVVGRSSRASNTFDDVNVTLNNDTGSNYDYQWIQWSASATSSAAWNDANAATSIKGVTVPAASSTTGDVGQAEYMILNYAATTLNKAVTGSGMALGARSSGNLRVVQFGGGWRSTAAVTRVTLTMANGNWLTGSRATLYGLD